MSHIAESVSRKKRIWLFDQHPAVFTGLGWVDWLMMV